MTAAAIVLVSVALLALFAVVLRSLARDVRRDLE